jgi:CheY-like chemotaxis protein
VCAANGLEALRALEAGGIDVAFMDVQMPELDGLSATKRIRADRSGRWDPGMPVVALTAFALGRDAANFLAGGMNLVVAKPVTEEALSNALEEVSRLIAKR